MTDVIEMIDPVSGKRILEQEQLKQAKEQGVGPDGLLNELTNRVRETALEAELSEHLGFAKARVLLLDSCRRAWPLAAST